MYKLVVLVKYDGRWLEYRGWLIWYDYFRCSVFCGGGVRICVWKCYGGCDLDDNCYCGGVVYRMEFCNIYLCFGII